MASKTTPKKPPLRGCFFEKLPLKMPLGGHFFAKRPPKNDLLLPLNDPKRPFMIGLILGLSLHFTESQNYIYIRT